MANSACGRRAEQATRWATKGALAPSLRAASVAVPTERAKPEQASARDALVDALAALGKSLGAAPQVGSAAGGPPFAKFALTLGQRFAGGAGRDAALGQEADRLGLLLHGARQATLETLATITEPDRPTHAAELRAVAYAARRATAAHQLLELEAGPVAEAAHAAINIGARRKRVADQIRTDGERQ